jgi:hypothetical protein
VRPVQMDESREPIRREEIVQAVRESRERHGGSDA